ncbi:MAG: discoidin domain-containing protein [Lentisphaeraceae bacterium]|nr:discoidin domain-containing protein [Lentisphaeraceae bacterium]
MKKTIASLLVGLTSLTTMGDTTPKENLDQNFPDKGKTPYLSAQEELKTLQMQDGYYLELVLDEPTIKEPVISVFDGNGNLYVAEMRSYMQDIDGSGKFDPVSRVSRHEDTNGDGKYDKHTVFADNLVLPRIVLPLDHRIIIGETNTLDLYCYEDTDGDGVSDKKTLWFKGGPRGGNLEHQPSGLIWSMDNWLYTTYNSYRLRFTNGKVEKENIPGNGGQWGLTQDDDGMPWYVNAGGEKGPLNFQWPITYGQSKAEGEFLNDYKVVWPIDNVTDVQGGLRRVRDDNTLNHFTATCGQAIFRGDRLPEDIRGDLLFSEPVGRLIRRTKIENKDGINYLSHPYEKDKSEFIRTKDPNFHVVNMDTAPDGSLYLVDMYRGIIQEGNWVRKGSYLRKVVQQHHLDKNYGKGRIWRLRHKDFKLGSQPRMLEETPTQLVKHLSHPNGWWRDTAQKLLILKADTSVKAELEALVVNGKTPEAKMHALWTLEGLSLLTKEVAIKALNDQEPRVRKTAIRVSEAVYTYGDKSIADSILEKLNDTDVNVKMQAVLSAKYINISNHKEKITEAVKDATGDGFLLAAQSILKITPKNSHGRILSKKDSQLLKAGKDIYSQLCTSCHGKDAKGQLTGKVKMAPPLVGSPRVIGDKATAINIVMHGLTGEIDGKAYPGGLMIPMGTNGDKWIASVLSYVRTHFGNHSSIISKEDVTAVRKATKGRKVPWTLPELEKNSPSLLANKKQWKLTASHGQNKVMYAIDGNWDKRYDSGAYQTPGMWFQVELPTAQDITAINIDSGPSQNDFPKSYSVEVSLDGKNWTTALQKRSGQTALTEIKLSGQTAKFIKITLHEKKNGKYWSIHAMDILARK